MSVGRREHDPELPWGHWLRLDGTNGNTLVDEDGREWRSVREAFLEGRLRMPPHGGGAEFLELLLVVLTAKARRNMSPQEAVIDIFAGNHLFRTFLLDWMTIERMLNPDQRNWYQAPLTCEGASIMLMLAVTRPPVVASMRVGTVSFRTLVAAGRGVLPGEERRKAVEAVTRGGGTTFLRRDVAGKPTIALTCRDAEGPMPLIRTVWSQSFHDDHARDAFFDWLCERLDRWQAWAEIAFRSGGAALTAHFLSLLAAGMSAELDVPSTPVLGADR